MVLGFGGSASSRSIHYMNQAKSAMDKSLLKFQVGVDWYHQETILVGLQ